MLCAVSKAWLKQMKVPLVCLKPMQQVGKSDKIVLEFGVALSLLIMCSLPLCTCD